MADPRTDPATGPGIDPALVRRWRAEIARDPRRVVVIDDDPTGTQGVSGIVLAQASTAQVIDALPVGSFDVPVLSSSFPPHRRRPTRQRGGRSKGLGPLVPPPEPPRTHDVIGSRGGVGG